ncbi:MAG TPA: hypothetical protein VFB66_20525 [Tepidisphaeraceae bacterium]|nr:hypothetical protein [Tepidisphaeraceae bacterium]
MRLSRTAVTVATALLAFLLALPAAAGTKASFNADGVLVIDGKKVFPIGFTMPPPPDGKTPAGRNGIEELHDAGANFLRTGVMGTAWDEAAFAREQAWQDAAARHGMHCLVSLREASSVKEGDVANEAKLRAIVNRFKDHPGMGAWKGVDEPEWGKHAVEPMVRAHKIIKALDPHHPVWVVQAPRGTVESMRRYNVACDATGADIYPVGYPPGGHSLLPNNEISLVGDHTGIMVRVADGKMPVWMVLQIAWSGVIKPGKTLRFPTFAEERFMTYHAIVNGARGVVYFGGHIGKACTPEDANLGWNWTFWDKVLRPVVEEIGEKSPLYPALVAPESKLPVGVEGKGSEGVEFCVREVGDDVFLIGTKREGATVNVRFTGLPGDVRDGEVLFESPRRVEAKDGGFTDWFGPFEVHVYRFKRG